jgi:hypothetical protein
VLTIDSVNEAMVEFVSNMTITATIIPKTGNLQGIALGEL